MNQLPTLLRRPMWPRPEEVVNVARVPRQELELDYRTHPHLPEEDENYARVVLLLGSLLTSGLVLLMHAEPLGATVFGSPYFVASGGGFSLWGAIILLALGQIQPRTAVRIFLGGVAVSVLVVLLYYASQYMGVLAIAAVLGFAATLKLVDSVLYHQLSWLNANPFMPAITRRLRKSLYEKRGNPQTEAEKNFAERLRDGAGELPSEELVMLRQREMKELRGALGSASTVLLPYLLLPLLPHRFFVSWLTLLIPPALALMLCGSQDQRFSQAYTIQVTWKALINFLAYERKPAPAPGVFHSPVGIHPWRLVLFLAAAFLLSAAVLPLVHFFPLGYEVWQRGWPQGTVSPQEWEEYGMKWALGTPGSSSWYAVLTMHRPGVWPLFSYLLGVAACAVFPALALGSILLVGVGPSLCYGHAAMEGLESDGDPKKRAPEQRHDIKAWDAYLMRLAESKNEREQNLLWMGSTLWNDYPVVVEPELLWEHAYLRGDTGSGKTALGMTPLVMQLLRQNDAAIVIIDLKGDTALFHAVREEAERCGRVFKWFTNELHRSTYVFNPLRITRNEGVSLNQVAETLLEALSLSHGEGYGRGYFSRRARQWLAAMLRRHPEAESFRCAVTGSPGCVGRMLSCGKKESDSRTESSSKTSW